MVCAATRRRTASKINNISLAMAGGATSVMSLIAVIWAVAAIRDRQSQGDVIAQEIAVRAIDSK